MATDKILFVTSNFYPEIGSASSRQTTFAKHLAKTYDVTVFTAKPCYPNTKMYNDFVSENDDFFSFDIIRYDSKRHNKNNLISRIKNYLRSSFEIWKFLGKHKEFSHIIVSSPPLFNAMAFIFRKKKYKLILDVRDLWPYSVVNLMARKYRMLVDMLYYFEKKIIKKSDYIIVNSEKYIEYFRKINSEKKVIYIPNPIEKKCDFEISNHQKKKNSNFIHIGYAGNLGISQDISNVILIVESIIENNLNAKVTIIGYGYQYKKLKAIEKKFENILKVVPALNKDQVQNFFLKEIDIGLVLVKNDENLHQALPGKIIDLIGLGIPIIGFSAGVVREYIEKYDIGWDFSCGNVNIKLQEIFDDLSIIQRKSNNLEIIINEFEFDKTSMLLDELLSIN